MTAQSRSAQVAQRTEAQRDADASVVSLTAQRDDLSRQLQASRMQVEEGLASLARERWPPPCFPSSALLLQKHTSIFSCLVPACRWSHRLSGIH